MTHVSNAIVLKPQTIYIQEDIIDKDLENIKHLFVSGCEESVPLRPYKILMFPCIIT